MPSFEENGRRAEERLRQDASNGGPPALPVGYEDDTGQPKPLIGDQDAPYVHALARASTDPANALPGVPAVATGEAQRLLTDKYGRLVVLPVAPVPSNVLTSTLIPQAANAGVLVVRSVPCSLFDAWAGDFRARPVPSPRYLLLFDAVSVAANDVPAIAGIEIAGQAAYNFAQAAGPLVFGTGLVIAISTTPNKYTAIAAASDFAITARSRVT